MGGTTLTGAHVNVFPLVEDISPFHTCGNAPLHDSIIVEKMSGCPESILCDWPDWWLCDLVDYSCVHSSYHQLLLLRATEDVRGVSSARGPDSSVGGTGKETHTERNKARNRERTNNHTHTRWCRHLSQCGVSHIMKHVRLPALCSSCTDAIIFFLTIAE